MNIYRREEKKSRYKTLFHFNNNFFFNNNNNEIDYKKHAFIAIMLREVKKLKLTRSPKNNTKSNPTHVFYSIY